MNKKSFLLLSALLMMSFALSATPKRKIIDNGGSGPYKAVAVSEKSLKPFVVYRPQDIRQAVKAEGALPLMVFANGGCNDTSLPHERMLNDLASYGYLVIALGEMQERIDDRELHKSPNEDMLRAIDWAEEMNKKRGDYNDAIALDKIALGGQSCGGAQVMANCGDPRVKTCLMFNSGMGHMEMVGASSQSLKNLHCPTLYIIGGEGDIAYRNALEDYDNINHVPVAFANHLHIGHGGTFHEPFGGSFSVMLRRWMDWQLKRKTENADIFLKNRLDEFPDYTMKAKGFAQGDNKPLVATDTMTDLFNSSTAATTAATTYGNVAGYIDRGIYTYKGIPYAQAKRFEDPQAPKAWQHTRSCRWWGPVCPQPRNNGWKSDASAFFYRWNDGWQDEDCLRLNVWTPAISNAQCSTLNVQRSKRPVLVWLHGGGFTSGNGQEHPGYDGRNLAEKGDVVVVTLNHRLNCLGYLDVSSVSDRFRHSGNVGMLDIVEALKWVRDNIANFGGDPGCVTIFGQSGGGGKVSTLMCMPAAKGLFHRAMVMSGSGMNGMDGNIAKEIGRRTVEILGTKSAEELQQVDYQKLCEAASQAIAETSRRHSGGNSYRGHFMWGPVNDGDVLPGGVFTGGSEMISNDIPLILGSTLNEFSGAKVDEMVRPAVIRQAGIRVKDGGAPVYVYHFHYNVPTMDGNFRACHNSDIAFFFNNVVLSAPMTGATPAGIALGNVMSSYLINFARNGNPNGAGLPYWDTFNPETEATMILNIPACEMQQK